MRASVLVLLFALCITAALCTTSERLIHDCVNHCLKEKGGSQTHCEVYCHNGHTKPKRLEIFVDNVHVNPEEVDSTLSDSSMNLSPARFDKAMFNTPSAFDELVKWTDMLKQQVATSAERVFQGEGQFHMLPMPIPLSEEQIGNVNFMNRITDVVPASTIVFKETGPLTFSEAYREFLVDLKVDPNAAADGRNTPEAKANIQRLENAIEHHLNTFVYHGNECFMAYEMHLINNNLLRSAYSFDTYGPTNGHCKAADDHMAAHEKYSKELSDYLNSLNPSDEVFKSIAMATHNSPDWNANIDQIRHFKHQQATYESQGQAPNAFHVAVDMIRYYLKQEYFGTALQTEESCINAHVQFQAKGWTTVNVSPKQWFNSGVIEKFKHHATNSGKNYFGSGGVLQRQVSQLVVAYKPVLKFTVGKAMKDTFINRSSQRNYRAVEFGPMVFDQVEFYTNAGNGMVDTFEMVLTTTSQEPQVIGYKSKSFVPIDVPRVDTNGWAFCRRQEACSMNRIPLVPIYRYYTRARHFYTTNWGELGAGAHGWSFEGIQAYCHPHQHPGTVPIHRYSSRHAAHLYTTNWGELGGGAHGYSYEGVMCYVYPSQVAGTVPLHRYYAPRGGDRLFTTNWGELEGGKHGFNYEGVAAYVHTQDHISQAISCCTCS